MASRLVKLPLAFANRQFMQRLRSPNSTTLIPRRNTCYTETGAINPEPPVVKFGSLLAFGTSLPFLLLGCFMSMQFALLLDDTNLFVVPEDEDD